jgi:uncharacterized protein (TIGR03083 family)
MRPGKLVLQTRGACDVDPEHLLDVWAGQRQQFVAILRGFGPGDWAAPTRCADWSAHDVVRHLCDNARKPLSSGQMTERSTSPLASARESRLANG